MEAGQSKFFSKSTEFIQGKDSWQEDNGNNFQHFTQYEISFILREEKKIST